MKGETLIEVLIALSAAVIVITAVSVLSISSLSNSQFVRDHDQASNYAQEGIEVARSIRNSDYLKFGTYGGTYCLDEGQTALSASPVSSCTSPNVAGKYIRSITITQDGGCGTNFANTLVVVSWTSSKCASGTYCHSSKINSCFSTTAPISGP